MHNTFKATLMSYINIYSNLIKKVSKANTYTFKFNLPLVFYSIRCYGAGEKIKYKKKKKKEEGIDLIAWNNVSAYI